MPTVDERDELTKTSKDGKEAFLAQVRDRFRRAADNESRMRSEMLDDLRFEDGQQWIEANRQFREADHRPCPVLNLTRKFVKLTANSIKRQMPGMIVIPVDDASDPETARVLQETIRHIENNSDAQTAYGVAVDSAVACGLGWFEIATEFSDDFTFDQDIVIRPILNPFSVYDDPASTALDGSDALYRFVVDEMPRSRFLEEYPKSELNTGDSFTGIGDDGGDWITRDTVRVAQYWFVKTEKRTLLKFPDGTIVFRDSLPQEITSRPLPALERTVHQRKVQWCRTNGTEILEEGEWAGKWLPQIKVYGEVKVVNGERRVAGMIRHVKDAQRLFNYARARAAEVLALAPISPWVAAEGQVEQRIKEWQNANVRPPAVLTYSPMGVDGHLVPPPQRSLHEPPIGALSAEANMAKDDLMHIMGVYQPSLGAMSGERSGKAITALQDQGDTTTYHFMHNLSLAMRFACRQEIDLIPKIMKPGTLLRIMGADGKSEAVMLGEPEDGQMPPGIKGVYDPGVGKYDVVPDMGRAHRSKRQEEVETLTQLTQAFPAMAPLTGYMVASQMDSPKSAELAQMLWRSIPPEVRGDDEQQPIPPQVKQQMEQLNAVIEQLSQALEQQTEVINQKQIEAAAKERLERMQIESRERLEAAKLQAELLQTEAQLTSKENVALVKEHFASLRAELQAIARDNSGLLDKKPTESGVPQGTPAP